MKNLLLCFLFSYITYVHSITIEARYLDKKTDHVEFTPKVSFQMECIVSESAKVLWFKDDESVTDSLRTVLSSSGKSHYLKIKQPLDSDTGVYNCTAIGEPNDKVVSATITVKSLFALKVHAHTNVVEGEKLKIQCNVVGKPYPKLHWVFINETFNATYTESSGRVILEQEKEDGIENEIFKIEVAELYDKGIYKCVGVSSEGDNVREEVETEVHVKGKYAALWPFLGICVEVFVLCAIIFIYEKKRNKTELEESDTDQSPDQKNTPDHGKESNVRHRQ